MLPAIGPLAAVVVTVMRSLAVVRTRSSPLKPGVVAPASSTTACSSKLWPLGSMMVAMPSKAVADTAAVGAKPVIRKVRSAAISEPATPLMTGAPRMPLCAHLTGMFAMV